MGDSNILFMFFFSFIHWFTDNFNESDFDYLNNFGCAKERKSALQRDSILLKFDPLLAQIAPSNGNRLTATQEEDDFLADLELKVPVQETSQSDSREDHSVSANSTFGSVASVIEQSSQLLPVEDEMSLSVDIMKDISVENKTSETNHIEREEIKLRWVICETNRSEYWTCSNYHSSHNNSEDYGLKMAELENKIKKEAEMREEALLKRISEKDKQIAKMK